MDSTNPCDKRFKNECCIDRISDLPDLVLGKLLSHLPIKDVIGTSILSTRWRNLFPSSVPLTELVLDDSYTLHRSKQHNSNSPSPKFISFVDNLLNVTLRDAGRVKKVVIKCQKDYGDDRIVSWVSAALQLKVEHLRLMSSMSDSVPLFNSLHGCTTLVELEFGDIFVLDVPVGFSLPNLRKLSLYWLSLPGVVDSVRGLIAGCPDLNELRMFGCDVSGLDNLYIQHPSITKLIISHCNFDGEGRVCRVVLDAPNLETFVHKGYFVSEYVWENVKSLHSVCFKFNFFGDEKEKTQFYPQCRRLAELVIACSRTKHLCLYRHLLMALDESQIELPTFQNLTCLTLGDMGGCGWKVLARFLKRAPNLEVLTFAEGLEGSIWAYEGFDSELPSVPICLELHLEKIEIWAFRGTPHEVKLIGYFLKNGRVLKELIVHCLPLENRSNITKLSVLPRHSEACKVFVKEGSYPGNLLFS